MRIYVIATGGTIEKVYSEQTGTHDEDDHRYGMGRRRATITVSDV
jgi:L-asparaginase/Glu-tRNA(Gln) amidotransferase subunit D